MKELITSIHTLFFVSVIQIKGKSFLSSRNGEWIKQGKLSIQDPVEIYGNLKTVEVY